MLGHQVRRLQVRVEHRIPVVLGQVGDLAVPVDVGVAGQHVNATELAFGHPYGFGRGPGQPDVSADRYRRAPGGRDRLRDPCAAGPVDIDKDDGAALRAEGPRDGSADALTASADMAEQPLRAGRRYHFIPPENPSITLRWKITKQIITGTIAMRSPAKTRFH